jgi:hypothetical protein
VSEGPVWALLDEKGAKEVWAAPEEPDVYRSEHDSRIGAPAERDVSEVLSKNVSVSLLWSEEVVEKSCVL